MSNNDVVVASASASVLSQAELLNPKLVIENFFAFMHLHEAKQELKESLQFLLTKSYPHSPASIEHDDTIFFFEKVEKLIEAVYTIYKAK